MGFWDHLTLRGYDAYRYYGNSVWVDSLSELVTFSLYSLDHRLVGIQTYDYKLPKKTKYHTVSSEAAVWGLDTIDPAKGAIFVVEGVWDAIAIHALGFNAVAVLCNSPPKALVAGLKALSPWVVAVCDGDEAGHKLARHFEYFINLPAGEDASSLGEEELRRQLCNNWFYLGIEG